MATNAHGLQGSSSSQIHVRCQHCHCWKTLDVFPGNSSETPQLDADYPPPFCAVPGTLAGAEPAGAAALRDGGLGAAATAARTVAAAASAALEAQPIRPAGHTAVSAVSRLFLLGIWQWKAILDRSSCSKSAEHLLTSV